jgi:hypothetical protein
VQWLLENAGVVNPESVEQERQQVVVNNFVGVGEGAEDHGKRGTHGNLVSGRAGGMFEAEDSDDEDLELFMAGLQVQGGNVFSM